MSKNIETDVVVIGSGVAGLSAAIEAAEGGLRVSLFEKQPSLGGTSNFFHGIFAVESWMQKEQYIAYSRDQAFKNWMEYNHWLVNASLVRALINKSAETIDWLIERGVEFPEVTINMPDAPRTYHVVKGGGEAVIKALTVRAKEKGVSIKVSAPVKNIIKRNKLPAGIIVEVNDEDTEVSCKAIVIASGGYANNAEWIKKYSGFDLGKTVMPIGNVGKMGDGIRMAWEMGAASDGMGVLHMLRVAPFSPEFPFMNSVEGVAIQPMLWVDPKGERFCDEGIAYYDTSTGNVNSRYKQGYTFCLFDDNIKQYFIGKGVFRGMGMAVLPGWKLKDLNEQLEHFLSLNSKEFFGADSIEELARKMDVDPQVLESTIAQYNSYCEKGYDDLFAKDPTYLIPLKGPRYYAAKARTCFLGTLGGIKVNQNTEVIDQNDLTIPGLYAVGLDAGGLHAESYSMTDSSGAASAFAIISGRIAGENAVQYVNEL